MALPSYSTGTATVDAGGTNVALTDGTTAFNNVFIGDTFAIGTVSAKVIDVVDDEHFTITPWPGADKADVAYTVLQDSKLRFTDVEIALDLKKQVQALNTEGFYRFVAPQYSDPTAAGIVGDDGQYARQPSTKKEWHWEAGGWVFDGVYTGNIAINSAGPISGRSAFDDEDPGFTYFASDQELLYVRLSAGGWSDGEEIRGAQGEPGTGDKFDLAMYAEGRFKASEVLLRHVFSGTGIRLPALLSASAASAGAVPTADAVFSVARNGSDIGSVTFPAATSIGTFSFDLDVDFSQGDIVTITAPSTRDLTVADVSITLSGVRI